MELNYCAYLLLIFLFCILVFYISGFSGFLNGDSAYYTYYPNTMQPFIPDNDNVSASLPSLLPRVVYTGEKHPKEYLEEMEKVDDIQFPLLRGIEKAKRKESGK